jgi:nicotinate-nucleotide pyrophosphorylase (carboxylating)
MTLFDPALFRAVADTGLDPAGVIDVIGRALREDLSDGGDITTAATIAPGQRGRLDAVPRSSGVICGLPIAALVFAIVSDSRVTVLLGAADGDVVGSGAAVLSASGPIADLLTAERTALNLLCHLSGVATMTRLWAEEVSGTRAQIRDTRKTMPGLRALEKYAVRCGGGVNHRMSLSDAALIKDNHVVAAGSVTAALGLVRAVAGDLPIEVEVDNPAQCAEAIDAGATLILLDNMAVADLTTCVALAEKAEPCVRLEASGGLSLDNAAAVAATGVDYLAVGSLTHSAPALDIGFDLTYERSTAGAQA